MIRQRLNQPDIIVFFHNQYIFSRNNSSGNPVTYRLGSCYIEALAILLNR